MTIASPCIGTCLIDPGTGLCLGCGRSLAEIAAWSGLDDDRRRAIMALLPDRLGAGAGHAPPPRPPAAP